MRDQYSGEPLGAFDAGILFEIEADQSVLQELADRLGSGSSGLKEATAWLAEKVARLKLGRGAGNGLGTFEALEFLELGIYGKWNLWRALAVVPGSDPRSQNVDFHHLAARAESQRAKVDEYRLNIAQKVLT